MVGDWQHAEGPLMRARMSDKTERGLRPRVSDCMMLALDEARSILADAEPSDRGIFRSVRFLNAESGRMWAMEYLDERLALAESLRSFVEGN